MRRRAGLLAAVVAFGVGCDTVDNPARPSTERDLPLVLETDQFRFYAAPGDTLDAARTEAHFLWMTSELGVSVPAKIDYYKHLDRSELQRRTGRTEPFADVGAFAVHTVEPWERQETTRLVIRSRIAKPPAFFEEGLVIAHRTEPFDQNYGIRFDGQPVHRTPAIRLALEMLPPLETVIADADFAKAPVREHVQLQAGSFVRWLIDTYGWDRFRGLLRGSRSSDGPDGIARRFWLTYRSSLGQAERDWRRFLATRALVNAPVGLSDGPQADSNGGAAMVSFSSNGSILARNAGAYRSERRIPYEFDVPYRFRLVVDVSSRTYSAFVRAPGKPEQPIAVDYGFRVGPNPTPAARVDTLGLGVLSSSLGALGAMRVCDVAVRSSAPPAVFPCIDVEAGRWENRALGPLPARFTLEFQATLSDGAVAPTPTPAGPMSSFARQTLNALLDFMEARSVNKSRLDWPALRRRVLDRAAGAQRGAELYPAALLAVELLDDQHSVLRLPSDIPLARANTRQCEAPVAPPPALPADIGYVRVGTFRGFGDAAVAFADDVQARIRAADSPSLVGWVFDLRGNTGGNLEPMIAGIGPVLGEGIAGYHIAADGSSEPWSYVDGAAMRGPNALVRASAPYRLLRPFPRVAVLTDPRTTSSGEGVAVSFRARPGSRSFGTMTCGLSTYRTAAFGLGDGALVEVTTTTMADREGRRYGRAIPPDETIYDTDAMVRRVIAWLRSGE